MFGLRGEKASGNIVLYSSLGVEPFLQLEM